MNNQSIQRFYKKFGPFTYQNCELIKESILQFYHVIFFKQFKDIPAGEYEYLSYDMNNDSFEIKNENSILYKQDIIVNPAQYIKFN